MGGPIPDGRSMGTGDRALSLSIFLGTPSQLLTGPQMPTGMGQS